MIDVGNTRMKAARFEHGRPVATISVAHGDVQALRGVMGGVRPRRIVLGSTAGEDPVFIGALHHWAPVVELTGASPAPIRNAYATPATLGVDRLANAVAAHGLFPDRPVLAISAGTCLIYDLVDATGTYRGGVISPGLRMRAKAMHAYSARLPEVDPPEAPDEVGVDTRSSLAAGVHHGSVLEVQGFVDRFRQQHPGLAVVITGGDAPRYIRALKNGIFAHPSLTLLGLHALLEHQFPSPPGDGPAAGGAAGHSTGGTDRIPLQRPGVR